jgi:hypothetical protein
MRFTFDQNMKNILLLLIWSFVIAQANETVDIPPNLVQVKTGGQWKNGDKEGYIRFSTFEHGFENVYHRIVIEWIQSPRSQKDNLSVSARMVVTDFFDVWSIGDAGIFINDGVTYIKFQGTNSYIPEENANFTLRIIELGKTELTKD